MVAWHSYQIDKMDIINVYLHERAMYSKQTFVKEPRNPKVTYTYGGTIGFLQRYLWRRKSAGLYYM